MIPLFKVHLPAEVDGPLLEVLHSGWIGQGVQVDKFEDMLKEWIGNKYVLTLNNGTAGLHLALRLVGVGYGDEVITSPMTCTATNMPILAAGATPVWADIEPGTGNINWPDIAKKITPKTKAIIAMHFGGYPCDLEEINDIAKKKGIKVIEDAAHALGAEYRGVKIGTISDFTMFTLQAIKHITTVDGGLLCCRDEEDYARGKLLRWYGIDREKSNLELRCEDDIKEYGYKYHMNDVNATIGIVQMQYLSGIIDQHRRNAAYYDGEFKVRKIKRCKPLKYKDDRLSSYWLYTILADDRDGLIKFMRDNGIGVSRAHTRNDTHTCFKKFRKGNLPGVDYFDSHQIAIPVGWWLSEKDKKYIIDKIEEFDHV